MMFPSTRRITSRRQNSGFTHMESLHGITAWIYCMNLLHNLLHGIIIEYFKGIYARINPSKSVCPVLPLKLYCHIIQAQEGIFEHAFTSAGFFLDSTSDIFSLEMCQRKLLRRFGLSRRIARE